MRIKHIVFTLIVFVTNLSATHFPVDYVKIDNDTLVSFSSIISMHPDGDELKNTIESQLIALDSLRNPNKYTLDEHEMIDYYAYWKLSKDTFYLENIYSSLEFEDQINISELIKTNFGKNRIFASWITDTITLVGGKRLTSGYKPVFQKEVELIFTEGILAKKTEFENYIKKESNFWSINNNPRPFIYSQVNWNLLPELDNKYRQVVVVLNINKKGRIKSIDSESYLIEDDEFIQDQENPYIEEAIRVAKLIPSWDVIYQRDKIMKQSLSILFIQKEKDKYAR